MPSRPFYGDLPRQRILPEGLKTSLSEAQKVRVIKDELKAKKSIVVAVPLQPVQAPVSEVKNAG
ncbi:hypothetical protein GTQ43_20840 [Nostoc sp. KVJ3]|uniref:hypothetical protein n=1 Tax=Nostoc sp. KVJ3 TaxID=457945 RepID=UPI002237B27C|nr:hypothetical protein [Nostoc sp. KVJ3]MCW5315629.1 hypothetical protein [Nostoc sp. KVJ3]MCW5316172.1 hypothetical protein [Nostoc sp. KVJ3]